MTPGRGYRSACLLPIAVLACACAPSPGTPPATVNGPPVVSIDEASSQLAVSRCDHESACSDVGAGRPYATVADCAAMMQQSTRQDLARCTAGIEPRRLAACERRLGAESCRPLSTLSRMLACRPETLCANAHAPGEDQPSFTSEDVYGMNTPRGASTRLAAQGRVPAITY